MWINYFAYTGVIALKGHEMTIIANMKIHKFHTEQVKWLKKMRKTRNVLSFNNCIPKDISSIEKFLC